MPLSFAPRLKDIRKQIVLVKSELGQLDALLAQAKAQAEKDIIAAWLAEHPDAKPEKALGANAEEREREMILRLAEHQDYKTAKATRQDTLDELLELENDLEEVLDERKDARLNILDRQVTVLERHLFGADDEVASDAAADELSEDLLSGLEFDAPTPTGIGAAIPDPDEPPLEEPPAEFNSDWVPPFEPTPTPDFVRLMPDEAKKQIEHLAAQQAISDLYPGVGENTSGPVVIDGAEAKIIAFPKQFSELTQEEKAVLIQAGQPDVDPQTVKDTVKPTPWRRLPVLEKPVEQYTPSELTRWVKLSDRD